MVKPLLITVIFKCLNEHTGKNPMNIVKMIKTLFFMKLIKVIKEYILERKPMNVISVVRPLLKTVIFKSIKEHILERNPMNVISVVRPLQLTVI